MWEVYDKRTNRTLYSGLSEEQTMRKQNALNDGYAFQLIQSGKAPKEFSSIFMMRKTK